MIFGRTYCPTYVTEKRGSAQVGRKLDGFSSLQNVLLRESGWDIYHEKNSSKLLLDQKNIQTYITRKEKSQRAEKDIS